MKINLHNTFEIIHNNTRYLAYNTLLAGVYKKISNLEQYTSHIAVGTGTEKLSYEADRLKTYLRTFKAETEELISDASLPTMQIKKLVSIDPDSPEEFSFSELGLCASADFDPEIFNHVLLTDKEGNSVTINRRRGDTLQIRVTIFLELGSETKALFCGGENKLIARILGDDFEMTDPALYAVRGEIRLGDQKMTRPLPSMEGSVQCTASLKASSDKIDITFTAQLGEGAAEELLLVFDNQVVMRLSTLNFKPLKTEQLTVDAGGADLLELGERIESVISVQKGGVAETAYSAVPYSKKLIDRIPNPFDEDFNASTPRFVSQDGSLIAFISRGLVHLYKNKDYSFKKLNTTQMSATNLFRVFLFEDRILALATEEPYVRLYDIVGDSVLSREVHMNNYDLSVYPYKWQDAAATISGGVIILGLILENGQPLCVRLTKNDANTYFDHIERSRLGIAKAVFSNPKTAYNEALVGFLTDTFEESEMYLIEEFYESTSRYGKSSDSAFYLLKESSKIMGVGRAAVAKKTFSPYLYAYWYPDFDSYEVSPLSGNDFIFSRDGNYIIEKSAEGGMQIYNFHKPGTLLPFNVGLEGYDLGGVSDAEFASDMLLLFTSSNVFGILMKKDMTRIDNISDPSGTYEVTAKTYDLLGSQPLEGVQLKLILSFALTKTTSTLSAVNAPEARLIKNIGGAR